jgi:hypothetical protein
MEATPMSVPRYNHTATLLRDGRVLVAGGYGIDGRPLSTAEIYDPRTAKWSETGSMNSPHAGHRAVLQKDGKVLVYTGGFNSETGVWWDGVSKGWTRWVQDQELFDPTTGTWALISNNTK